MRYPKNTLSHDDCLASFEKLFLSEYGSLIASRDITWVKGARGGRGGGGQRGKDVGDVGAFGGVSCEQH